MNPSHPTPTSEQAHGQIRESVDVLRAGLRLMLGAVLLFTGTGHLTFLRKEFQAQVPRGFPLPTDLVVVASGLVELGLGSALITLPNHQTTIGRIVAAFFVAIFPGNLAQYANHIDAFGLNSDKARGFRLLMQPVLVAWALWATAARTKSNPLHRQSQ